MFRFSFVTVSREGVSNEVKSVAVVFDKVEVTRNHCKALVRRPEIVGCLLYTSPSPRDLSTSRMPSSA